MATREVYHSTHTDKDGWHVLMNGKIVSKHELQAQAELDARVRARAAYKRGRLGQAVLHKKNGTIRTEHTYGKDPERHPG
jgi:U3 small nucleolar ribonucleoprotein component